MGFILKILDGPSQGKEFFFEQAATLGRVEDNDVVLIEPGISRNHVQIYREQGIYVLKDLGSANGTRLNGEKVVEEEVLRDGDYISCGQTAIQFSQLDMVKGEVTSPSVLRSDDARLVDRRTETNITSATRGFLRSRLGKGILILAVLLVGGGVSYKLLFHKTQQLLFDQSDVPLVYSEEDSFFNAVFGNGNYDQSHLRQVIISFEYLGGRTTVQYGAWGVDKVGEVILLLNNDEVGKVGLTMRNWEYGRKLVLPQDKLKRGQTNQLIFRNTLNPAAGESWEVCYIQILQEAIPPPNAKEARHQFEMAKKDWEDREIEAGNRYSALVRFKKARDFLEGLSPRPELYQEALDSIELVDKALTRKFEDGLFSAKRVEKVNSDPQKARLLLLRTLKYFQKDDFRYRELKRYLDQLALL